MASGQTITVPTYSSTPSQYRRLAVAYPSTKRVTSLGIVNADGEAALGGNALSDFTEQAGTLTVGTETVRVLVSNNAIAVSGATLTVVTEDR